MASIRVILFIASTVGLNSCTPIDSEKQFMDRLQNAISTRSIDSIIGLYGDEARRSRGFKDTFSSWAMFFDSLNAGWQVTDVSFHPISEIEQINQHYPQLLKDMYDAPTIIDGQPYLPRLKPIGATVITRTTIDSDQSAQSIDAVGLDSDGTYRYIYLQPVRGPAEQGAAANP